MTSTTRTEGRLSPNATFEIHQQPSHALHRNIRSALGRAGMPCAYFERIGTALPCAIFSSTIPGLYSMVIAIGIHFSVLYLRCSENFVEVSDAETKRSSKARFLEEMKIQTRHGERLHFYFGF